MTKNINFLQEYKEFLFELRLKLTLPTIKKNMFLQEMIIDSDLEKAYLIDDLILEVTEVIEILEAKKRKKSWKPKILKTFFGN